MRKPSKGKRRPADRGGTSKPAQLIRDFLRDGITVTVGGVPIQITLGAAQPLSLAAAPRPAAAKKAKAVAAAPKPRRKNRRRRSKRVLAPDMRDIRGFLATRMEGSTLTALAQHFKVKRPLMKRMRRRMLDKQEITLFKGAFFNNKRLRQRRIPSRYEPSRYEPARNEPAVYETPAPAPMDAHQDEHVDQTADASPEQETTAPVAEAAPTVPTAVPDPEPEEPQTPESLPYPERDAA